jgi:hypothetical protein
MGKKRTHGETKDGFAKPSRDQDRMSDKKDKQDKRKNGDGGNRGPTLVRMCDHYGANAVANFMAAVYASAGMAHGRAT